MIVISCTHENKKKHGRDRQGNQRFRCLDCGKTFVEEAARPLGEMRISMKDAVLALGMLLEGLSIRATERLTGLHRDTLGDLILTVGANCERFFDATIKGLPVTDVQVDEIWSFIGCKEKTRVKRGYSPEVAGDSWTFTGIERNTKLLLAYQVGHRDGATCGAFLMKLKRATSGRFQLSTDGLSTYTLGVPFTLGNRVDFAQLIKSYAAQQEVTRYSPARIIGAEKRPQLGSPDPDLICTSHVERMNLTIRMNNRRLTRLTNAHSKARGHHAAMQAIFFCWYNFCRKHDTLKGATPAMASGLADKIWSVRELLENAAAT